MFGLKEYKVAQVLDQADEWLHGDKGNVILGGLLWMRMGRKNYHTGIDLSQLGLNGITETADEIEIGCMTTLRQIETSPILKTCFGSILADSVSHIVGVQFRNAATIGGSLFSRFSFSDSVTALLALETRVHLTGAVWFPLRPFSIPRPRPLPMTAENILMKRLELEGTP